MTGANRDFCGLPADLQAEDEPVWLSYAEAAKRVRKSVRTIHHWHARGMVMEWRTDAIGQRYRVVEEDALLAWFRQAMSNSPVHFYKLRAAAIERGETPPELPERFKLRKRAQDASTTETPQEQLPTGDLTASNTPQVPDSQDGETGRPDPYADLLRSLPEFTGQAEHAALVRAMEEQPPACDGLEVFTANAFHDPEQTEIMRGICRECPLLEMCSSFVAVGKPSAGMWAGMTPAEIRRIPHGIQTDSKRNQSLLPRDPAQTLRKLSVDPRDCIENYRQNLPLVTL